jgi:hypothetical protein
MKYSELDPVQKKLVQYEIDPKLQAKEQADYKAKIASIQPKESTYTPKTEAERKM